MRQWIIKELSAAAQSNVVMQAIYEIGESTQRMVYHVAGQIIVVEAHDSWSVRAIEQLFKGWHMLRAVGSRDITTPPAIVMRSAGEAPQIPVEWPHFNIAGGGVCFTDTKTSYLDIEGSIVAIGEPGNAAVEVWTKGMLELQSQALTRVVTYALGAAMRRRGLFELHSGAVVDPKGGRGVLIIGPSGSGKSTLTVQLAAAGWSFLTDDVLLLRSEQGEVKAWPVRRCFAVTAETFAASDFLRTRTNLDYTRAQPDDKKQFVPEGVFNSEFKEQCIPSALFFSELRDDERSKVFRLSTAGAMTRLIRMSPWSCYDRTTAADHLGILSNLATQATAYSLHAGKDLLDPETAASLIAAYTRG